MLFALIGFAEIAALLWLCRIGRAIGREMVVLSKQVRRVRAILEMLEQQAELYEDPDDAATGLADADTP